jgi:hypothetical protein
MGEGSTIPADDDTNLKGNDSCAQRFSQIFQPDHDVH